MTCSLLWVRCLFDPFSILGFGGKWPLKWKFSKMSIRIPQRDTELRFLIKFGKNQPLQSYRKVLWITTQKKLGLRGTRLSPNFAQNGRIVPKISWTFSPFDVSTYTEFVDQICLKTRNSEDECTFPLNIFAPTPKITPKKPILGDLSMRKLLYIEPSVSRTSTLMELRRWNFTVYRYRQVLGVYQKKFP